MKRRHFIRAMAGGCMAAGVGLSAGRRKRMTKGAGVKKLVVLFQRGGNDGLNTLIPVDPTEYGLLSDLRPTVRIPQNEVLEVPGSSFFGLHPAMASLSPIMAAGDLSFVHAVGYPNPDRSHFESQSFYETAVPGQPDLDGWLSRTLLQTDGPGFIRGISIGSNIPQSASGDATFPVSTNFGNTSISLDYRLNTSETAAYDAKLRELMTHTPRPGAGPLYDSGNLVFNMLDSLGARDLDAYTPENGAAYPDTPLGDRVRHAAQMLRDDPLFLGVEMVTIDQPGYDTHAGQLVRETPGMGSHARLLEDLADCMAAFYTDLGPVRMADTVFLVVTEFGRRAYQNNSLGTDHGTGCVSMVMGGGNSGLAINGGDDWPTLADLYRDDDLHWVTDFRDIYWEILSQHMGVDPKDLAAIIPGHSFSPVGILT